MCTRLTLDATLYLGLSTANPKEPVILGGTVAVGAPLVSDSNGKAVSATQATAGAQPGSWVFAVARQAGVLGDIIEVEGAKIIY